MPVSDFLIRGAIMNGPVLGLLVSRTKNMYTLKNYLWDGRQSLRIGYAMVALPLVA